MTPRRAPAVCYHRPMRLLLATSVLFAATACGSVSTSPPDASSIDAPPTCAPACGAHATCQGTTCVCDPGYAMNGGACTDIDECATANGGCAADATCTNTDGARTCACDPGFLGDGLACRPVWTLEATLPFDIDPSQFGSVMVAHNDLVYIGVETNTTSAKAFRSYNTTTRQVSGPLALPPATDDDFCACGATQTLASDGTNLYMFGNYATKYNPGTDSWSVIPGYTTGADYRRAESASVYNPMTRQIQAFGGRGPTDVQMNFSVQTATFAFGPALPFAVTEAVAYLPAGSGTIYLAGGQQQGGADRILSRPIGSATWAIQPAAPVSVTSPIGMGGFGARVWVAERSGKIVFFNPGTATWDHTLDLPPDTRGVATTTAGTFAFARDAMGVLRVYKLANID